MNALPINLDVVSTHPHVSGAYGDTSATTGSSYGQAGSHIHNAKMASPMPIPTAAGMNAFPCMTSDGCALIVLQWAIQHAIPVNSVAAERIAYDSAVVGRMNISPIHTTNGRE